MKNKSPARGRGKIKCSDILFCAKEVDPAYAGQVGGYVVVVGDSIEIFDYGFRNNAGCEFFVHCFDVVIVESDDFFDGGELFFG